jgi:hypothetical protein
MLTPSKFDALLTPLLDLYEDFIQSIINDIARRLLKTVGLPATAAWQMVQLVESGGLYEDILDLLAVMTGKSTEILKDIFKEAGIETIKFDNRIYEAAGLKPLPINLSLPMQQVLLAGLRKTAAEVYNMTLTTALASQQYFVNALDLAYMQVSSGTMGYMQSVKEAVSTLADEGVQVIDYKKTHDQVDVAVRRAVLTGVAQTAGNIQLEGAKEMDTDLVQTSAHIGARPSHALWQGKVFSLSGTHPKYPPFSETGYGTGPGLCGWNCRHQFYPFYEGISENVYNETMVGEYEDKKVKFNGQEITVYEASQDQRKIERAIRKYKREAIALGNIGLDASDKEAKVKEWQANMRDFIKQTGMVRQPVREGGLTGRGA